ncbi:MAG: tetratricopeptide repeat protein [Chlamydiae bacterium]|nr:tetratricopeptide repeat protein [Chlamydiota bacterium]MBI3266417.1 tetratricopeptide repeat protein [Chlamydiota bacterium]
MKNKILQKKNVLLPPKKSLSIQVWKWLVSYRSSLLGLTSMVLLVGLMGGGWFSYQNWRQDKAMRLLSDAKDDNVLDQVIEKYPKTPAALYALIGQGASKVEQGKMSDAIQAYEKFLFLYPRHLFVPWVKNALGECYLHEKRFAEAEVLFKALSQAPDSSFLEIQVKMNLARLEIMKGRVNQGVEEIKKFRENHSTAIWKDNFEAFVRFNSKNVQK